MEVRGIARSSAAASRWWKALDQHGGHGGVAYDVKRRLPHPGVPQPCTREHGPLHVQGQGPRVRPVVAGADRTPPGVGACVLVNRQVGGSTSRRYNIPSLTRMLRRRWPPTAPVADDPLHPLRAVGRRADPGGLVSSGAVRGSGSATPGPKAGAAGRGLMPADRRSSARGRASSARQARPASEVSVEWPLRRRGLGVV